MNTTTNQARGVKAHVTHASGRRKTVCSTAVLAFFGIDASTFHYSQNITDILRLLRSRGYSARSRMSTVGRGTSVGRLRSRIAKHDEKGWWLVRVPGHAMLLKWDGSTVVDTAPRKRDRRQVTHLYLVRRKEEV